MRRYYRTPATWVVVLMTAFSALIWNWVIRSSYPSTPAHIVALICAAFITILTARFAFAGVEIRRDRIRVVNPFWTVNLRRSDIERLELAVSRFWADQVYGFIITRDGRRVRAYRIAGTRRRPSTLEPAERVLRVLAADLNVPVSIDVYQHDGRTNGGSSAE